MTPRFLLDADICIHLLRKSAASPVQDRFRLEAHGLALSTIVLTELRVGAGKHVDQPSARIRLDRFCAPLFIVDFDDAASEHAADIRRELERAGQKIGPLDTLIAGHARSLGASVVTGNIREFSRVPGLRCEDWIASAGGDAQ